MEAIYKSVYQSDGNEIYLVDKLPEKKDDNEKLLNHMLLEQLIGELGEEERMLIRLIAPIWNKSSASYPLPRKRLTI